MAKKKYTVPPFRGVQSGSLSASDDLESFKAEDIKPLTERKFKRSRLSIASLLQYALMLVCAVVFIVCLVLIVNNLVDKYKGNKIYSDASGMINPITINSSSGEDAGEKEPLTIYEMIKLQNGGGDSDVAGESYSMDLTAVKASLSSLKQVNSDVIGWIYVENTRINYPLMQSSNGNREYYLTHAYTGEYLAVGSIYLSVDCEAKLSENFNSLIYGHNVANGTMFHDVLKFDDEEFFNNTLIYIYTLDGAYIYKPFSIYQTASDYNYIQTAFDSESEFLSFADKVKGNSHIASDESIAAGDKIITLSTCTNGGVGTNGRWALHAKLAAFVK